MAESLLSLSYPTIAQDVAEFLGYTTTIDNLGTAELRHVQRALDSGTRRFVGAYDWSWLYSSTTVTTVSGTDAYSLPDDYGHHLGGLKYAAGEGRYPIPIVSIAQIRESDALTDQSGYPTKAAIIPDGAYDGTDGQRWQVVLWPTPNSAWTLTFEYSILVDVRMRSSTPYPLGGQAHAETLRYACLAAAELDRDDARGPREEQYKELLAASIAHDKRMRPDFLGYNQDRSLQKQVPYENYYVTVNGVLPS